MVVGIDFQTSERKYFKTTLASKEYVIIYKVFLEFPKHIGLATNTLGKKCLSPTKPIIVQPKNFISKY